MGAICLVVGFAAWVRDFTVLQFVLELAALLIVFLVIQSRPAWWLGLHLVAQSVLAFLFFAIFGLAFVWASASGIGLVVWALFFGTWGLAAVHVPRDYSLAFCITVLLVVVVLYEIGVFRPAL